MVVLAEYAREPIAQQALEESDIGVLRFESVHKIDFALGKVGKEVPQEFGVPVADLNHANPVITPGAISV